MGGDSPTANAQAQEKLETLKKRVAEHVEPANALSYDLPWAKDGFDPSVGVPTSAASSPFFALPPPPLNHSLLPWNQTHKHELYLSRMCQDVEAVLKRIIAAVCCGVMERGLASLNRAITWAHPSACSTQLELGHPTATPLPQARTRVHVTMR